ncbi:hypothetical protein [Asaia krungthepensis]|uniref:Uncharacterized protein n=1 Tax=Asaia krungthepensis NRIC 0535 TaxID=1307925 RepID=A0ABQ0Q0A5_9PROT|nr:hypothetical protein [Asaia krungthepensis]GBQ85998.1 hypothetical protein AA0535_0913 [Asaia krungthepensis NRIC 0535]
MKRDCFVIPSNLPKANWLISFINSVAARTRSFSFDIVIGTSNEQEYRRYARLIPTMSVNSTIRLVDISGYISRVLQSETLLDRYNRNAEGCIINVKKFALLKWACDQGYERIGGIDGDTAAIRDMDGVFDAMQENYRKKLLVGSSFRHHEATHITAACLRHFSDANIEELKLNDGDYLYSWFFDVPYYERNDLNEFFDFMSDQYGSLVAWFETIRKEDFEHQIFHYWLYFHKGYKLFDTRFITSYFMPESCLYSHFMAIRDHVDYSPVWIYTWEYLHQPDIIDSFPSIFMLSHFDRMFL